MNYTTDIFRRGINGFTLVELIITLAITAIITTMAVPSFQGMIRKNRMATQTNEFITALHLARSEAVKRGVRVTLCKRSGDSCSTSVNWENGWIAFTDIDGDGTIDDDGDSTPCEIGQDDDCVLHVHEGLSQGTTLRTGGTFADWIAYLPNGLSKGSGGLANDTLRLCPHDANTNHARAIRVNAAGRPRLITEEKFTSEGVTCP